MRFERINEGFVCRTQPDRPYAVAAGPRCAVTREGHVVCSYMRQSALGINDFRPMLSRSHDGGETWQEGSIWPHLQEEASLTASISRSPEGDLFLFGTRTPVDLPGESFWSHETQGLKENQLLWAKSVDSGKTWCDPQPIPMPIHGSAEAPGPLCVTRSGQWLCCYSPYNTFDPGVIVDRRQVLVLRSADQGRSWSHASMLRFEGPHDGGAEAWVIELADGRLLGASWRMNVATGSDYPNAYALSLDGGLTWTPTRSTGIMGQSCALTALPDGHVLFVYNQRKSADPGVWMAVAHPTEVDFGLEHNAIVWSAEATTQRGTSGEHSDWEDFSFGEPSVTCLPDGALLVALWCIQPSGQGIRYVKLRMVG